jgi:hypothetical protein
VNKVISIQSPQAKKYITILLAALMALIAAVVSFNVIVDPYGMFRMVEMEGFNAQKPAIYNRIRLSKAYDIRRIKPRTIILGTSRTHLGLRPSHPAWGSEARPVYNLAFDGATTKEMYYYLRHAQAVHPLQQVVLGLDVYHPTLAPGSNRPDFDPQLLMGADSLGSSAKIFLADLKLLISFDTLAESIATINAQKPIPTEWLAQDGQRLGKVFFHQPWENYQRHGPRYYFDEIDKQEVRYKLEWRIPAAPKRNQKPAPEPSTDNITSLDYIQRIIELCRWHKIDLRIFFTPAHVHQMEISAATGEWPSIESGKRALVRLLSEDAAKHPHQQSIPLYDFSGYSAITTEVLPKIGSADELNNYWDSSHFKDTVGDQVLNRLFGIRGASEDFGVLLTSKNIEQALTDIRSRQQIYRTSHPQDIQLIHQQVDDFKRAHNIIY